MAIEQYGALELKGMSVKVGDRFWVKNIGVFIVLEIADGARERYSLTQRPNIDGWAYLKRGERGRKIYAASLKREGAMMTFRTGIFRNTGSKL